MSIIERVNEALKSAMRAKDSKRLDAIRALRGEIIKAQKSGADAEVTDDDVIKLAKMLIKQRRDAVEQFRAAGRDDLVQKDEGQITVLEEFLPEQMSEEALGQVIDEAIAEVGAESMKDMGKVMKAVMAKVSASGADADGKTTSAMVKSRLA